MSEESFNYYIFKKWGGGIAPGEHSYGGSISCDCDLHVRPVPQFTQILRYPGSEVTTDNNQGMNISLAVHLVIIGLCDELLLQDIPITCNYLLLPSHYLCYALTYNMCTQHTHTQCKNAMSWAGFTQLTKK